MRSLCSVSSSSDNILKFALEAHVGKIVESHSILRWIPTVAADAISFFRIGRDGLTAEIRRSGRAYKETRCRVRRIRTPPPSGSKSSCKRKPTKAVCWSVYCSPRAHWQHSHHHDRWSCDKCRVSKDERGKPDGMLTIGLLFVVSRVRVCRFTSRMADSATPFAACSATGLSCKTNLSQTERAAYSVQLRHFHRRRHHPCHQASKNRNRSQQAGPRPLEQAPVSHSVPRATRHAKWTSQSGSSVSDFVGLACMTPNIPRTSKKVLQ